MKIRVVIVVLLTLLLSACVRREAPSHQGNWDRSTWDSVSWQ
jgi:hypothetical protein